MLLFGQYFFSYQSYFSALLFYSTITKMLYSNSLKSLAGCLHQGQMKSAGKESPS